MKRHGAMLSLLVLVPLGASAQDTCKTVPYYEPLATPPGWALSADGTRLVAGAPSNSTVSVLTDYLRRSNTDVKALGDFGYSVSVDGDWMAVGAPADGTGSAYVVDLLTGRQQSLSAPDLRPGDRFGASVSIAGDWLAVGAPDRNTRAGAAYLFKRSGSGWTLTDLRAEDGRSYDTFGASVAVSSEGTVVVGAPYADDLKVFYNFGAAYVFEGGMQKAKLLAADTFRKGDIQFGSAVAIEGGLIAVGAPGDDVAGQDAAGSAYLFTRDGGTWSSKAQRSALIPVGQQPAKGRQLGTSVDIENGVVAVGAPFEKGGEGSAWLFDKNGRQIRECLSCPGVGLGRSVALWNGKVFLGGRSAVAGCFEIPPLKPDLTCELETLPATVVAGGTAAYTVRVTNRGPGTAEPARLEVETPPELSASCAPEGCSVPIPAEKSRNFVISFTLPPGCSSPISIQPRFSVRSGTGETEDCSPPPILVQRPRMDLVCRKSGPEFVEPGGRVVYQVEVTNNGCKPFRDVDVSDPAPPFLERDCGGSACASRIARIEPGETRNVSFAFRVSPDYSHTAIMNVASIVQAKPPEADMENNSCTARTEVRCPGLPLGIQGSVEGEKSEIPEGSIFTYHLRLANGGPGVLEDGPRSELIQTSRFNFLSSEIVAGGGQLYLGCPSGCPFGDLHWNGSIPRCGNVDIQVTATADHAGEFCLDATFVDLDGRLRPATPYCFRIVPGISLPSGGR
jgi:uncharacterized repeat protein (TIGR01451 family)